LALVKIYGPNNSQFLSVDIGKGRYTRVDNPVIVDVEVLEDALLAYGDYFRYKIDGEFTPGKFTPAAGPPGEDSWPDGMEPRYFLYEDGYGDKSLVDIHVTRDEIETCPKQDLTFAFVEGDVIDIGQLVC
jgi:hypothetical protein